MLVDSNYVFEQTRKDDPDSYFSKIGVSRTFEDVLDMMNDSSTERDFFSVRVNDVTSYFYKYKCSAKALKNISTCAICLDRMKSPVELNCSHSYCRDCLVEASNADITSCPLCRTHTILSVDKLRGRVKKMRNNYRTWRTGGPVFTRHDVSTIHRPSPTLTSLKSPASSKKMVPTDLPPLPVIPPLDLNSPTPPPCGDMSVAQLTSRWNDHKSSDSSVGAMNTAELGHRWARAKALAIERRSQWKPSAPESVSVNNSNPRSRSSSNNSSSGGGSGGLRRGVGHLSPQVLLERWRAVRLEAERPGEESGGSGAGPGSGSRSVGHLTPSQLQLQWVEGTAEKLVGGEGGSALLERWRRGGQRGGVGAGVKPSGGGETSDVGVGVEADAGAGVAPVPLLSRRWAVAHAQAQGAINSTDPNATAAGGGAAGCAPLSSLTERWRRQAARRGGGAVAPVSSHAAAVAPVPSHAAAANVGVDVGVLACGELVGRWEEAVRGGGGE